MKKNIVLIQLNEINFEVVQHYLNQGVNLPVLENILANRRVTVEHEEYENLEPWIQWYTVYSGKRYAEHKVFHLGDGHERIDETFYTDLSREGISVGAVAPMNLSSKVADFSFFVPDPWSSQTAVGGFALRWISDAIKQGVNDNSGTGISLTNKVKLLLSLTCFLSPRKLADLFAYYRNVKGKGYRKALFLDCVIANLHMALARKFNVNFSTAFLNAGAHIQHHYFLNSTYVDNASNSSNPEWYIEKSEDPVFESLVLYEELLSNYVNSGFSLIVATGLQQVPYLKNTFYYRLQNHAEFLNKLKIPFLEVRPRMTRDFEIVFKTHSDSRVAIKLLKSIKDEHGHLVFSDITETSETSLFCTLTYAKEIKSTSKFYCRGIKLDLLNEVNFVAVKNGMHEKHGTFFTFNLSNQTPENEIIELHNVRPLLVELVKEHLNTQRVLS